MSLPNGPRSPLLQNIQSKFQFLASLEDKERAVLWARSLAGKSGSLMQMLLIRFYRHINNRKSEKIATVAYLVWGHLVQHLLSSVLIAWNESGISRRDWVRGDGQIQHRSGALLVNGVLAGKMARS